MFVPTTALQKILALKKRIRAVQGGTGASKTVGILQDLIDRAQRDKIPTLTSVVSESIPHLKKGCIRDFERIMKEHNYWKERNWFETDKIYTFETGSQVEFFGADQSEKLRGGRRDRLFINECNNVSFKAFEELEVRTKELIYLDWNPVSEFWFETEVIGKRDDIEHLVLTYLDNEGLSSEIITSIETRKNRGGWWRVYGLGQLGEVEGRIFKDWNIIDEIPHEARLERYGLDFGYTNDPSVIVAIYYYNGGYIVDEVLYQKGMSNKEIADTLLNQRLALVIADSAEPKSIDEIKSYGVNIVGVSKTRGESKSETFKKWSIGLVQNEQMSVTKRSVNTIKEYRNYLWITDKNGRTLNEPEHEFSHGMDAVCYAMTSIVPIVRRDELVRTMPRYADKKIINEAR